MQQKHLKGHSVYHTVAAEVVSTINSTTLYLDKVLSDLLLLMGPKLFLYIKWIWNQQNAAQRKKDVKVSSAVICIFAHYLSVLWMPDDSVHGPTLYFSYITTIWPI